MEVLEKQIFENADIISSLEKWRILRLKDLDIFSRNQSKKGHYLRINKLEKAGIVHKVKIPSSDRATRYAVMFTKAASEFFKVPYYQERFLHDLMVSSIVAAFSELPSYIDVIFDHEMEKREINGGFSQQGILPDATVLAQSTGNDTEIRIAVEVEMTRKSKQRILEKFEKYITHPLLDVAIYFFVDQQMFNTYSRYLIELLETNLTLKKDRVYLVFIKNPNDIRENLKNFETVSGIDRGAFGEIFK